MGVKKSPAIAIFGGAGVSPGAAAYRAAENFSRTLSAQGWAIRCGGYGGIMAAVARGAKRGGGGAHGVLLAGLEGAPSPDLISHENAVDLYDRLRRLIEPADCFAAFTGSTGTLNEIAMLLAFHRSGQKLNQPLLLIGKQPAALPALLIENGWFPAQASGPVHPVANVAAALRFCARWSAGLDSSRESARPPRRRAR